MHTDPSGNFVPLVTGAAGALVGAAFAYWDGDDQTSVLAGALGGFVAGASGGLLAAPAVAVMGTGIGSAFAVSAVSGATGNIVSQGIDVLKTGRNFSIMDVVQTAILDGATGGVFNAKGVDKMVTKWASSQIDDGLSSGTNYINGLLSSSSSPRTVNRAADMILDSWVTFERRASYVNEGFSTLSSNSVSNLSANGYSAIRGLK